MAANSKDQSGVAHDDMKKAEEGRLLEQFEKIAKSLSPRPNKKLMKDPDRFVEILIEVIDKIKGDPKSVSNAPNSFYLDWSSSKAWACDLAAHVTPEVRDWFLTGPHNDFSGLPLVNQHDASRAVGVYAYLLMDAMKTYVGSGTSLAGVGGIRRRVLDRANVSKKHACQPFERYLASHPDEGKQVVELMETRTRSPDDPPYEPIDDDCIYWKTCGNVEQEDLDRLRFLTILRENVFMMLLGSMSDTSMNHCCAWKPTWGGFNVQWALKGNVLGVLSPYVDGVFYDTKSKASCARLKLLDPVGHRAKLDKAIEKRKTDPVAYQAKLDKAVAKNNDLKTTDPVGYRATLDKRNAKNDDKKAADPVGHRAKLDKLNAKNNDMKTADPVGYQAKLDKANAQKKARRAADPVKRDEANAKRRAKRAADPVKRDEANAKRVAKRAADKISTKSTASNHSITDFFSKRTKVDNTNSSSKETELGLSKYFAKK